MTKSRIIEISTGAHADSIILPINPGKVKFSLGQKNQVIDLLEMGEVMALGNRALATLSFSSFFPSPLSPFARFASRAPWDYFAALDRWRTGREVVRVIIGGTDINLACGIEKLEPELREGDDDLYYSISFKEYRRLNVPAIQHSRVQRDNGLLERPDVLPKPGSVIIRSPAENWWFLACKYYGDGGQWRRVAAPNGRAPDYPLQVGDRVVLPP